MYVCMYVCIMLFHYMYIVHYTYKLHVHTCTCRYIPYIVIFIHCTCTCTCTCTYLFTNIHVHIYMCMYMIWKTYKYTGVVKLVILHVCTSVFDKLIWRTIGPMSFLFGTALWASGTVNYDYIITNSINYLLIGSRCIPNGAHILTIIEPIWPMHQNLSKTLTCGYV